MNHKTDIKNSKLTCELQGQIERITFTNEENGFTIAKLKVYGYHDLVTIVGTLFGPVPGVILKMKGEWIQHEKYGEQFKIIDYKTKKPASVYGIRKYLGSGLIKGIGPVMADRLVEKFGKDTLNIIENNITRLESIEGIGKKRISMIESAWNSQKEIREVMLFLHTYGVSSGYAVKIFKYYGNDSISTLTENPYKLAMDIYGIGFVVADKIAEKLGFMKDSLLRAQAGIIYMLHKFSDEGHVYSPYDLLVEKCIDMLEVDKESITEALDILNVDKRVVIEELYKNNYPEYFKGVYLPGFYYSEISIAKRLKDLSGEINIIKVIQSRKAIRWVQSNLDFHLAGKQIEAIKFAIENKVLVITGGPGTGKTTIINAIIKIYKKLKVNINLAAPTGRAAKRMSEATGHEARTIHRLLEFSFTEGRFKHHQDNPLKCDLLIVDEASMLDTILMHHLMKSIPDHATFILVGDVHQLPSVGAGNVLNDIIDSGSVPVVTLNEIFRQAEKSQIIINAHKINKGILPENNPSVPVNDFYFIKQDDPEKILSTIVELVKERIPNRFGFDPVDDIQVLTPMYKGIIGSNNINKILQKVLNQNSNEIIKGNRIFRTDDKVMQIKNNYDKNIFNGDIGRITKIIPEEREVLIKFDDREIVYDISDLDEIILAYAVSVHKSQGSEYPVVIFPVTIQHYMLLQRNLIYTGVSRGKKLVILIGTYKAMSIGINNNKTIKRFTYLKNRLS